MFAYRGKNSVSVSCRKPRIVSLGRNGKKRKKPPGLLLLRGEEA